MLARNVTSKGEGQLGPDGRRFAQKIENLRAGEYVLATDPTTGESGARKVTEVRTKTFVWTMVELKDSSGGKIQATDEHPFWVESEKRWVKAVDLKPTYRFPLVSSLWTRIGADSRDIKGGLLARMIKSSARYPGGPVGLCSCNTGSASGTFAQSLADHWARTSSHLPGISTSTSAASILSVATALRSGRTWRVASGFVSRRGRAATSDDERSLEESRVLHVSARRLRREDRRSAGLESATVLYLERGEEIVASPSWEQDLLDKQAGPICQAAILTDGEWIWPSSLADYVKTYHVELPAEFVEHMASRDWDVPELDEDALDEICDRYLGQRRQDGTRLNDAN